jgi:hypothetical protein
MDELEKVVDILQTENDKKNASDPLVKKALATVYAFIQSNPVLCYGGTAINNLLPKKDQFYDPTLDVPDYDFFSKTPQEHAMRLANKLKTAGMDSVEVRPGMHLGTFKVYADYEPVADITELDADIFDKLWAEDIVKDGVHYVTPDFLRMSMYLELSRPRGDVSRWIKVFTRLELLNAHYPIKCRPKATEDRVPVTREEKRVIRDLLASPDVVLLGINAANTHLYQEWTYPITFLATKEFIEAYTKGKSNVTVNEGSEILPPRHCVTETSGKTIQFYETAACHSYNRMPDGTKVASIPTILQFFFAYLYSNEADQTTGELLCIAQRLMEIAEDVPSRRFSILTPIECIGTQKTLTDLRREKAKLYEKYSKNKQSVDFLRYFFTYSPSALTKTQRAKVRASLRKTRKALASK